MTSPRNLCVSLLSATLFACGAQPASPTTTPSGGAGSTPATGSPASSTPPQGSVGTVSNNTLTPRSAASAIYAGDLNALLLVVSNQADYCSALTAGQTHANHVALAAELLTMSATGETVPVTPGTYTIISDVPEAPGNYALAAFRASDSNCNDTLQDPADAATAGTVTVTAVSGATVSGSYNVTFPEGTVAGTFAAPACFALAAQAKDNPTLTCEP